MSIAQSLLPEFDHEVAVLRTLRQRVPAHRMEFNLHAKSMAPGRLAGHLTERLFDVFMLARSPGAHDECRSRAGNSTFKEI